jgi:hypothetical protein
MKKLTVSELKKISSFSSGYISGGSDYWTLYEFPNHSDKLLIHSSGSNFGWEYDDWEFIKRPTDQILAQFLDAKVSEIEKCKLILAQERTSIYALGFSKPDQSL